MRLLPQIRFCGVLILLLACVPLLAAEPAADSTQWPRFRGPGGNGYLPQASIPDQWDADDYDWQFDFGSRDVGSPIVQGGKVFLLATSPDSKNRKVVAIDLASGQSLWERSYPIAPYHTHSRNTYASSTPAANDTHLFVAWGEPTQTILKCFTHDGEEVWTRNFGSWVSQHGFGTSPALIGDLLVFFDSQQGGQLPAGVPPGQSRMIAVQPATGETVWETPLTTTRVCYGVPALYAPAGGKKQIVAANTGDGLFGLDYATGKKLWNEKVFSARCVSSPVVAGDLIVGTAGSGGGGNHLVAVRPTGDSAAEVYRITRGAPYVPSPVVAQSSMFLIDDKGFASCIDAATGDVHWMKRVGGNYGASPLVAGDKLLVISLNGEATVLAAKTEYAEIAKFDLGGPVGATPLLSDGRLLLRIGNRLCCLNVQSGS
ncbi:outer membrane biogenesis protein BamB [Roseimaritima multifibrata]|uniref:Outer membrane biogenesis protein BamB n=1 Tax=Roseimaritima multifibrata TaxID=1930274 RepID=A0A517MFR4_9BACT|nr:PQQ-binding-like beta-propeller repeat protein [Roseimaritima multifibrata]QDS93720.1 outer membrane biogenesis protein BamB [Roseimaritima multifibrata]